MTDTARHPGIQPRRHCLDSPAWYASASHPRVDEPVARLPRLARSTAQA
ncbi:hypothetical protein LJR029_001306 [Caballeronia sp. LjRoot29]